MATTERLQDKRIGYQIVLDKILAGDNRVIRNQMQWESFDSNFSEPDCIQDCPDCGMQRGWSATENGDYFFCCEKCGGVIVNRENDEPFSFSKVTK